MGIYFCYQATEYNNTLKGDGDDKGFLFFQFTILKHYRVKWISVALFEIWLSRAQSVELYYLPKNIMYSYFCQIFQARYSKKDLVWPC